MTEELLNTGCQCPNGPPCFFCTSMTEDEANAYANGGIKALRELQYQTTTTKNCTCSTQTLMREGCTCGHLIRKKP